MKKTGALVFILAGFGSFSAVHAEQFGTAEEARAMLDRAIAALNVNQARALSEFNNTKNTQFHDRDLYISCYNTADGKFTAFPSRAMIGADIREIKLDNDSVGQGPMTRFKAQLKEASPGWSTISRSLGRTSQLQRNPLRYASAIRFAA